MRDKIEPLGSVWKKSAKWGRLIALVEKNVWKVLWFHKFLGVCIPIFTSFMWLYWIFIGFSSVQMEKYLKIHTMSIVIFLRVFYEIAVIYILLRERKNRLIYFVKGRLLQNSKNLRLFTKLTCVHSRFVLSGIHLCS